MYRLLDILLQTFVHIAALFPFASGLWANVNIVHRPDVGCALVAFVGSVDYDAHIPKSRAAQLEW